MGRPSHQDDRQGADRELAREAEEYRERVETGKEPGSHKPEEKTPYREALDATETNRPPESPNPRSGNPGEDRNKDQTE